MIIIIIIIIIYMQKSICAFTMNDWVVPSLPAIRLLQLPARSVACTLYLHFLTISSSLCNDSSFKLTKISFVLPSISIRRDCILKFFSPIDLYGIKVFESIKKQLAPKQVN